MNTKKLYKCRHHQHGRWQARIGRVAGNKDLYLGTFSKSPNPFRFFYFCQVSRLSFKNVKILRSYSLALLAIVLRRVENK